MSLRGVSVSLGEVGERFLIGFGWSLVRLHNFNSAQEGI